MGSSANGWATRPARSGYEEAVAKKRLSIDSAAAYIPAKTRLAALKAEPAAANAK